MGTTTDDVNAGTRSDSSSDHVAWLSWLKVFAIVAVIVLHTTGYNASASDAGQTALGLGSSIVNRAGLFAVPVFVMISGALLLNPPRYAGAGAFITRRTRRLVPAIIVWHVFYFLFRRLYLGHDVGGKDYLIQTLDGRAFQGLYYLWIILGLVLITPVVMPFVAQASRRSMLIVGGSLALIGPMTVATHSFRQSTDLWVNTPWTWWMLYLGFFFLGAALRDVVVRPAMTGALLLVITACVALIVFSWYVPGSPAIVDTAVTGGYYSIVVLVYAVSVFVCFHSLVALAWPFSGLVAQGPQRWGKTLGDSTLGVFVLHTAVIMVVVRLGILGENLAADSALQLAARCLLVVVVSFAVVWVGRQVPWIRRVL